jgi:hypothetical protein
VIYENFPQFAGPGKFGGMAIGAMDTFCFLLLVFGQLTFALRYDPQLSDYNLNENKTAKRVLDYSGKWTGHTYKPSPSNWRFPFYTLFVDRFADGDPENNDINGTVFETDTFSNQFRFGGDMTGLGDSLDYIQGIGIKVSDILLWLGSRKLTVGGRVREFISLAPPLKTSLGSQIAIRYAQIISEALFVYLTRTSL